jgi:hypothetical protein
MRVSVTPLKTYTIWSLDLIFFFQYVDLNQILSYSSWSLICVPKFNSEHVSISAYRFDEFDECYKCIMSANYFNISGNWRRFYNL